MSGPDTELKRAVRDAAIAAEAERKREARRAEQALRASEQEARALANGALKRAEEDERERLAMQAALGRVTDLAKEFAVEARRLQVALGSVTVQVKTRFRVRRKAERVWFVQDYYAGDTVVLGYKDDGGAAYEWRNGPPSPTPITKTVGARLLVGVRESGEVAVFRGSPPAFEPGEIVSENNLSDVDYDVVLRTMGSLLASASG